MTDVHAIIPAAGRSRRYGAPKQLLRWNGATLLARAVAQAKTVCGDCVTVVVGAHAGEITQSLSAERVNIVSNPDWREGVASSIRAGVASLPDQAGAVLFLLCDQPMVDGATLSALVGRWREKPERIVASYYNGTCGVPAVFPRSLFGDLLDIKGDRGAKPLFDRYPDRLEPVPVPQAGIDIDTPADLESLLNEYEPTGGHYDSAHHQRQKASTGR